MGRLNVDKSVDFFLVAPPASKPSDGRLTAACQQLNAQRLAHPSRHFNISMLTFRVIDCTNTDMRILPGFADKYRLAAAHREMRKLHMQNPGKEYYVCLRTFEIIPFRPYFRDQPVWEVGSMTDSFSDVADRLKRKALRLETILLRYVLPAAKLVPLPVESAACMKRKNLLALIYPLN